jgi:clumping factor A
MKKKQKRFMRKLFVISTLAVLLFNFLPFGTAFAAKQSLADINLLRDVDMGAVLKAGDEEYTLDLTLTGKGLLDVEVLNPEKSAVFYNPDVAKKWNPNGKADVTVEMLPISLADIPAVVDLVNGVLGTVGNLVNTLTGIVDGVIGGNSALVPGVITIKNLDKLGTAIDALNNLDDALIDLTDYNAEVDVIKGPNGEIIVNFSDGLGTRLETLIDQVVRKLLTDVKNAITGLEIEVNLNLLDDSVLNGLVGDLVGGLPIVEGLLGSLLGTVLDNLTVITNGLVDEVEGLLDGVLDTAIGTVDTALGAVTGLVTGLLDDLVTLNLLGNTTIKVPLTVVKPSGLNGDYDIHGILANTSTIDLSLLGEHEDYATITFNEKTPTTPGTPGGSTTLPKTSAGIMAYGLMGLSTLLAGVTTRRLARKE